MFKFVVSAAVLAAVVALPSRVDGRELKTVKFEVLPSSSVALEFKARKVEWAARTSTGILVSGEIASDDRVLTTRFAEAGPGVRVEER